MLPSKKVFLFLVGQWLWFSSGPSKFFFRQVGNLIKLFFFVAIHANTK
jgi:hypothetical protein